MTYDMTRELMERVAASRPYGPRAFGPALNFVCAALIAHDAAQEGTSPYAGLDVERVFAAVELLAGRHSLEVTPFVATWHPGVDAWDQRSDPYLSFFDKDLTSAIQEGRGRSAKQLITRLIDARTRASATGATYRRLAEAMLVELRSLVATTRKKVAYLDPLVKNAGTVATLNYDLAVEQAAEAAGIPLTTGIDQWVSRGRFNEWPSAGVRLLKLHGSINWGWKRVESRDGHLPRDMLEVTADSSEDPGRPALIFGQRGKLRAEGPFLGLLAEFEQALARASHLIVIGYSFRDDHVNELVRRWTAEDSTRTLLIVDPFFPESFGPRSEDFRRELTSHLVPSTHRPDEFEPRVDIWRMKCSDALKNLDAMEFMPQMAARAQAK